MSHQNPNPRTFAQLSEILDMQNVAIVTDLPTMAGAIHAAATRPLPNPAMRGFHANSEARNAVGKLETHNED